MSVAVAKPAPAASFIRSRLMVRSPTIPVIAASESDRESRASNATSLSSCISLE
jgi:hypothetical protein